jgi:hypothetical protein
MSGIIVPTFANFSGGSGMTFIERAEMVTGIAFGNPDATTSSTSFVDIGNGTTDLPSHTSGSLAGGNYLAYFEFDGFFADAAERNAFINLNVDGSRPTQGTGQTGVGTMGTSYGAWVELPSLSAATHVFKLQWKTGSGGWTLHMDFAGSWSLSLFKK